MSIRKIIGKLHLWLGLLSGLVVFIVAITGCIYAFQSEIQELTQGYRRVEAQEKPFLPPSSLRPVAESTLPGKHIHSIIYGERDRAAQAVFYSADPEYYYITYLNPYTGEVLKVKDIEKDFFRIILMGHFYLWLPHDIGQPVVATATLIFVVMLISGIILWWPRNKAARKQRFKVKWNARWRRKNYDLHNVLGFYVSWIAIFIAITGLVWGFQWFARSVYFLASGDKGIIYEEPLSRIRTAATTGGDPIEDRIWHKMQAEHPDAETLEVHFPESDSGSILAAINPDASTYWKMDYRFFDQYTMEELNVNHIWGRYKEAEVADKIMRMNYDIHVGAIMGLPGKCIAFFVSLIVASLPVTGFMVWYGRRKKAAAEKVTPKVRQPETLVLEEA